jgi:hypothetical protein
MKQVKSLILAAFLICTLSLGVRAGDIGSPGIYTSGDIGSPGAASTTLTSNEASPDTTDASMESGDTSNISFEELVFALFLII